MSVARGNKTIKVVYPPGCKEVTDELGKDELVRRLKLIARAFQDMGQEDYEEYAGLALHLATDFFMDHPNKDVRLLVACCIADVFRIFAPEAPYRDAIQLKDIFMFLIKQLRGLEDPNSPTFKRYFYLLENLAWVKSFNICIELEDNQEIFCSLFQLMFSVINERHTTKVKTCMLDMMAPLLAEADTVSQELLDILLLNIVEPHKTQNRHAYSLAKELLMRTCNAIEPYVQAFFNNALMLGKTSESEVSDHLYDLIYELNAIAPSVLLAVLPQLEFKLKSNEESERKQVTKILSKMFSDQGSNLAEQNKQLWICFLGRFNDISITVRTLCVSSVQNFVLYHPELVKDVVEQIKLRQHDAEETVRNEVVNTLLNIAKKNFDSMTEDLLNIVKERTRDKKFKIRRDALMGLGSVYKTIMLNEESTQTQIDKISFVKDKVFHAYYNTNPEDKLLVERLFNMCLVPYTLPSLERMKKLYQIYATLDENAVKAFGEMMKYRHNVRNLVRQILEALETTPKMFPFHARLMQISKTLPDSPKSLEQLKRFTDILREDKRLRTFMKSLISPDCTCKKANDTVKDIQHKLGGGHANASQAQMLLYTTVKYLLERIAPIQIDAQSLTILVQHIDDAVKGQGTIADGITSPGEKGVQLLLCLSSVFPGCFKAAETFETLISFLKDEDELVVDTALQILTNTGQRLEQMHPEIYAKLLPVLQTTAKIGNPKQAKHAIRCINAIASNKETVFSQIFEHVKSNLSPESANFITSIVALGHISWLCPIEFGNSMKAIVSKNIVKDLLMVDRTTGPPSTESWYGDHFVTEETNAKLQAMKLLMRWLLGLKNNNNNSGSSTLRLLYTVIVHEGDLMERGKINKPELARLRLQAGCCMLKIAEETVFADIIAREQFQALALLINDSCYHVRLKIAAKLHKGLIHLRLPLEYMCIFSLAANDPLRERRAFIKKCIQLNVQKRREYLKQNPGLGGKMFQYLPDYVMPYTIHLLAHDPDLKSYDDLPALKNIKECLWFMMEPLVARSEDYNYHFFRRLIENVKQTKDAQNPEDEETNMKLYAVCDVALGLLTKNLTNVVLKETNVDPALPAKLFTKPDKNTINATIYLPKDFNFDKKKGMAQQDEKPLVLGRGGKPLPVETVETIVVQSPGPVVNPNPTCPREPRAKQRRTKGATSESFQESAEAGSNQGSDSSQETAEPPSTTTDSSEQETQSSTVDSEPQKPPARRKAAASQEGKGEEVKKKVAQPRRGARNKREGSVSSQNSETSVDKKESESQEPMDTSQEILSTDTDLKSQSADSDTTPSPPPPKKRILKRTLEESEKETDKTETPSGRARRNSTASNVSDTSDKSGREKSVRSTKGQKRQLDGGSQEEEKEQGSVTKKKKLGTENGETAEKGKKGKGKRVVKENDPESTPSSRASSRASSVSSEKSPASQSTTNASFKSPSSPAPKATTKKKGAKATATLSKNTVTRGKLKEKPVSSPSSKNSSAAPTPKKKPTKTSTKKSPSKSPGKKLTIKLNTGNVRRAKPLTNGTSDDSDSGMSAKKSAALSKAIQKGKLGKETKKKPAAKGKKK